MLLPPPRDPPLAPPAPPSSLLPGLLVVAVGVALALAANRLVPALSPAMAAVALGAVLAGCGGVGERLRPGLRWVSRRVLRAAIVLLGLQIAVPQVLAMGWRTVVIVLVATGVTFALTPVAGRRLGLPPGTSLLVATGVSICGAAAVAAMHDTAGGDDEEAAAALSVVVLYGSAALVVVPLLASWLGLTPAQLGVWTGAAVHEVAQVAAIGAASGVLTIAVTVKLGRVILLAPIVALTAATRPRGADPGTSDRRPPVLPLFVAGFLAMVALRGAGLVPEAVIQAAPPVTDLAMAAALFGLGTGIDPRRLARGGRVMLLGGIATALIAGISLAGVSLLI